VRKRLACFTVDDPSVILLGRETITRNGTRVGWLSSGGYGHSLGCPIGYGYVRNPDGVTDAYLTSGSYALEVASDIITARLHLQPLHDPQNLRIRADG